MPHDHVRFYVGQKAYVYRNLHKHCYSVMIRGKVLAHVTHIELTEVEFRVRKGGLKLARKTGKRNVHAFAVGIIQAPSLDAQHPPTAEWLMGAEVTYRYQRGVFHDAKTGKSVKRAAKVHFNSQGLRAYQAS